LLLVLWGNVINYVSGAYNASGGANLAKVSIPCQCCRPCALPPG